MALPRIHRLTLTRQTLSALRAKGKSIRMRMVHAYYLRGSSTQGRMSVVISVRIAKSAVVRNRIRRMIHEAARAELPKLSGVEIVVYPKREIVEAGREEIKKEIQSLFIEIGKWKIKP